MRNMIMILLCLLSQMAVAQKVRCFLDEPATKEGIYFGIPASEEEIPKELAANFQNPQRLHCWREFGDSARVLIRLISELSEYHSVPELLPNVQYVELPDCNSCDTCFKIECKGKFYTFKTFPEDFYCVSLKDFIYHLTNTKAFYVDVVDMHITNKGELNMVHCIRNRPWLDMPLDADSASIFVELPTIAIADNDKFKKIVGAFNPKRIENNQFELFKTILYYYG